MRPSAQRCFPWPGNTLPGPCRISRRQRCSTFGFTSSPRATPPIELPRSSRCTAASLNSFVNILLDNPMTQFSFEWILSLNCLCQPRGQAHRVNCETQCLSTFDAYQKVGYSPSNRALRETRLASCRNDPEVGIGSRYTLKLLVVSVLPDRSVLLSSRSLMQWPRSYAPVSDRPSPAPSRRPTNFGRTLPTDHYRPAWPHS